MSERKNDIAVLVVEDEPLVRLIAADWVEECGYRVLEASQAEQAIHVLEQNPGIAVLFTDVDMPGRMDGVSLAHYVRNRWPSIRTILTSGKGFPSDRVLPARTFFLSKPYGERQVAKVLCAVTAA